MPERTRIPVGDLIFEATTAGPAAGPAVLLLHGFPQTSHCWRHLMPELAAAGFRAVAFDQRGYSPGARPEAVEAYAVPRLVADVLGVADALGHPRFHLVGHDWGGVVAWRVAALHPERVISLTALSTPHPAAFAAAMVDPDGDQARRSSYFAVFAAPGAESAFLAEDAALLRSVFEGSGIAPEDIQVYVDALRTPADLRGPLNYYRALLSRASGLAGGNGRVAAPVLYAWGARDPAFGRRAADATGGFVEGPYTYLPLEEVGHWIPEEVPDLVAGRLIAHLEAAR